MRSQAYDLVLNGWELGSGSVRIHRPDIQQQIFSLLGIGPEEAQAKFGFLLDAFRYGAPPHAGFAFGIDRLVALLVGEENIREVIAFPKTQSGADPLTGAPTAVDPAQLTELGLRILPRQPHPPDPHLLNCSVGVRERTVGGASTHAKAGLGQAASMGADGRRRHRPVAR